LKNTELFHFWPGASEFTIKIQIIRPRSCFGACPIRRASSGKLEKLDFYAFLGIRSRFGYFREWDFGGIILPPAQNMSNRSSAIIIRVFADLGLIAQFVLDDQR
jgi:hypothetical protein